MTSSNNTEIGKSLSSCLSILTLIVMLLVLAVILAVGFVLISQSAATTATGTQAASMEDVLGIHKEVLETVKWIVTIFTGLLTASGVASLIYGMREVNAVQTKVEGLGKNVENLKKTINNAEGDADDLITKINALKIEKENIERSLGETKKRLAETKNSLETGVKQLQTIYEVNVQAVKLLDDQKQKRELARRALVELSKDNDPVVRRECIRIFSKVPDYPTIVLDRQWIISRLKKLASEETEEVQAVRLDAMRALRKFGAIPDIENENPL